MFYFWWQVFWSAVLEMFAFMGKDPSDVAFSGAVVVIGYVLVVLRNKPKNVGWGEVNANLFKKAFSDEVRILIVLCCLIFVYQFVKAPYRRWSDEHATVGIRDATIAKQSSDYGVLKGEFERFKEDRKPHFSCEIEQWAIAGPRNGMVGVMFWLVISNTGAPSIVKGYTLEATMADGRTETVQGSIGPSVAIYHGPQGTRKSYREDTLYNKTAHPIMTGDQAAGTLFFIFYKITAKELITPGAGTMTLRFLDINNASYSCPSVNMRPSNGSFEYVPGTKFPL
jgi:hypothetical protein